jgi:hypothetical protein
MNWQSLRHLEPEKLVEVLKTLGLSHAGAARYLGLSERQLYRMVHGHAPVPVPVCLLFAALLNTGEMPVVPKRAKRLQEHTHAES